MKIVQRIGRHGDIRVYPFIDPDHEIVFHGYLSTFIYDDRVVVVDNTSSGSPAAPEYAIKVIMAWTKILEFVIALEKDANVQIEAHQYIRLED